MNWITRLFGSGNRTGTDAPRRTAETTNNQYPFLGGLTLSHDSHTLAWVQGGKPGGYQVSVASTLDMEKKRSLAFPSAEYPPYCLFLSDGRLALMGNCKANEKVTRLSVFDAEQGVRVDQTDLPGTLTYCRASPIAPLIVAEGMSSGEIEIINAADLSNPPTRVKVGQVYLPGPTYGPDGDIYYIHAYALHVLRGSSPVRIMDAQHCICFGSAGDIYCGDGYHDRSGPSMIHIFNATTKTESRIDWGVAPVDFIMDAGSGRLLVCSRASRQTFADVAVTLYDTHEAKALWTQNFRNLQFGANPIVGVLPSRGLFISQQDEDVRLHTIVDGLPIRTLQKKIMDSQVQSAFVEEVDLLALATSYIWPKPGHMMMLKLETLAGRVG